MRRRSSIRVAGHTFSLANRAVEHQRRRAAETKSSGTVCTFERPTGLGCASLLSSSGDVSARWLSPLPDTNANRGSRKGPNLVSNGFHQEQSLRPAPRQGRQTWPTRAGKDKGESAPFECRVGQLNSHRLVDFASCSACTLLRHVGSVE